MTQLVNLTATELRTPTMDWSVEDVHKEFILYKLLTKMWLKTKSIPDHKQNMFMLQLLGKECLSHWESFHLSTPNNDDKEQPECIWETFKGSFR